MINKKILAGLLLVSIATAWIWSTFANNTNTWSTSTWNVDKCEFNKWFWFWKHFWNKFWHYNLTDTEKTALKTMTNDEKKAFLDKKELENKKLMDEKFAKMEKKEAVIDALLTWNKLTSEQEILKTELIKERSDRKKELETRKNNMLEIKRIIDKKESWVELTNEEKTKIEQFKWEKKGKWRYWR